jgi:hypothetical protein
MNSASKRCAGFFVSPEPATTRGWIIPYRGQFPRGRGSVQISSDIILLVTPLYERKSARRAVKKGKSLLCDLKSQLMRSTVGGA